MFRCSSGKNRVPSMACQTDACFRSGRQVLLGCSYQVMWGSRFFSRGPSLGVAAPAGLPVGLSTGGAAGLAGDGWFGTTLALAGCLGYLPPCLCIQMFLFHAVWILASLPVVLSAVPPLLLFGGRYLLGRSAGGWLCRLLLGDGLGRSLFLASVRLSALLPLLGEVDCVLKYLSFCMAYPRPGGAALSIHVSTRGCDG